MKKNKHTNTVISINKLTLIFINIHIITHYLFIYLYIYIKCTYVIYIFTVIIYKYIYSSMCVCPTYSIPPKNTNNPQQYWLGPNSYIGVKHLCNEQISLKCSRDHHRTRKKHMATTQYWNPLKNRKKNNNVVFQILSLCRHTWAEIAPAIWSSSSNSATRAEADSCSADCLNSCVRPV